MRLILKAFFVLFVLTGLLLGAIAFLVPEDLIREQVSSLVRQQTGRELTVKGRTAFTFYPNVGVDLGDVTLSGPPGMEGGPLLRMSSLNVNLRLLPLIARNVEIEQFVLVRPVITLHVDAQGRRNWDFDKKSAALEPGSARSGPRFVFAQAAGGGGYVDNLRLGSASIVDGIVLYSDARTGAAQRIDAVNVTLKQESAAAALKAKGDFVWRAEKINFNADVGSITALTRNAPSAVKAAAATRLGQGSFDGRIAFANGLAADGMVAAKTASLREFATWTGAALPAGRGLGPASVNGNLKVEGDTVTFAKANLALDGMTGQGTASLRMNGARPYVRAALALDRLDLNAYIAGEGAGVEPARAPAPQPQPLPKQGAGPAPQAAPAAPAPNQSLGDFIDQLNRADQNRKPQVRAWNQRAIDVAGLRAIDADLKLSTGAIHYQRIRTGKGIVTATLKNGILSADLSEIDLYEGSGAGRLTLDSARDVPAFASQFQLDGVSALPLLRDAAGFKWVSGKGKMQIALSGSGRSQSEIVRTLQGNGAITFSDGAIEGVNIAGMIRSLKQGQLGGWKDQPSAKTDFSLMSGTFTMQNGIATNTDLNLVGPLVRVTGSGRIDVPREYIDYDAMPRLVGTIEGQGSQRETRGILIPVKIKGPWADPDIKPDLQKILENPELAADAINKAQDVLKNLKDKKITGKDVENLLQGVLGGGQQQAPDATGTTPPPEGQQPQQQVRPEDVLKQLFRN
ncbi:MAG: AsmA family protein [Pseudomonadota bacterium]|nr:AsmA family protein [Pseudomonadota bacterium]